jgi:thiamine-monophosphate kinase
VGKRRLTRAPAWREFRLIESIRRRYARAGRGDVLGLGDDAAAYRPEPGRVELVTCDALVEGVHWDFAWCPPRDLGKKTAAVNLSDIAAMGGEPRRAFLILALPPRLPETTALAVTAGLAAELARHGARLAGGDTVASSGPMMISLTLQGVAAEAELLTRAGARPGDWLAVTGDLGAAGAGLRLAQRPGLKSPARGAVLRRLLAPSPRLREGRVLARSRRVTAAIDLSDGLAGDVRRLAEASRVGIRLAAARLPIAASTRRAARDLGADPLALALGGGEDYELLFTLPPEDAPRVLGAVRAATGTPCTVVGEIVSARKGLRLIEPDGREVPLPVGWEHKGGTAEQRNS